MCSRVFRMERSRSATPLIWVKRREFAGKALAHIRSPQSLQMLRTACRQNLHQRLALSCTNRDECQCRAFTWIVKSSMQTSFLLEAHKA